MWVTILGFVGKLFGDMVTGWFKSEKAVEADWKAKTYEGKMRSYKSSATVEKKIANVEVKPEDVPTDAKGWNNGAGLVLLCMALMFTSGCSLFTRYVEVKDRKPIIETTPRPELSEGKFNEREQKLVKYSVTLETKITTYNDWAKAQNIENEYEDAENDEDTDRNGSTEPE